MHFENIFSFAIWKVSVGLKWRLIGIGSLKQSRILTYGIYISSRKVEIYFIYHPRSCIHLIGCLGLGYRNFSPIRFLWTVEMKLKYLTETELLNLTYLSKIYFDYFWNIRHYKTCFSYFMLVILHRNELVRECNLSKND